MKRILKAIQYEIKTYPRLILAVLMMGTAAAYMLYVVIFQS